MTAGERDLARLLGSLDPFLHPDRYAFVEADHAGLPADAFALIREEEGITLIRPDVNGAWARISLGVHSSLDAVGLTAALSRRLADAGISANIVAASRHDHIFVPWERREQAVDLLRRLA